MIMKYLKIYMIALLSGSLLISCTKEFEELNTDPNRISAVSPGSLLNPLLYSVASYNMERSDNFTAHLMQVKLVFPSESGGIHRYDISENTGSGVWNTYYRWLAAAREMRKSAIAAGDPNYEAIAMTLEAWIMSNLTDAFGDVPMKEAARGEDGIWTPEFDTQEEIYNTLLAGLDSANTMYETSRAMPYTADILMGNNVMRWKKFTNSLRMRLLLRVIKRTEMNALAELTKMINDEETYPVFKNNAESAILHLDGVEPMASPWGRPQDFTAFRAAGAFFVDKLNELEDPRRPLFLSEARSLDGVTSIGYKGIPSGFDGSDNQFEYQPSNFLQKLVIGPMIVPILPYAEVEFIKAEVHLLNGDMTASEEAYKKGVQAAIEQWGGIMPAGYFDNPNAAFNGTLERIMIQKYLALFFVDFQQWFEARRTGYPVLPKGEGMLNNQELPVRFYYPVTVRTMNTQNYNEVVSRMGGDDINIKGWWEL